MTPEELNGMPSTAHLMNEQELLAWLASRKEVGEAIEVEAADLKGEWVFEEAPYQLHHLFPSIGRRNHDDSSQQSMRYFVRSTQCRGWIGERDLTEEKKKVVRCRVEERERGNCSPLFHPMISRWRARSGSSERRGLRRGDFCR
jgi:hypothetical protein